MARKKRRSSKSRRPARRKKKGGAQRAKFARAAKAAMSNCIVATGERGAGKSSDTVRKMYGACMRKEMRARL